MKFNKELAKNAAIVSLSVLNAYGAGCAVDRAMARLGLGHDVEVLLDDDQNVTDVIMVEKTPKRYILAAARKTLSTTAGLIAMAHTADLVNSLIRVASTKQ